MAAKKTSTMTATKKATSGSEPHARVRGLLDQIHADPKLTAVVAAYERDATKPGRKFGKNGLKTKDGKLFALFTQNTLVVKLRMSASPPSSPRG